MARCTAAEMDVGVAVAIDIKADEDFVEAPIDRQIADSPPAHVDALDLEDSGEEEDASEPADDQGEGPEDDRAADALEKGEEDEEASRKMEHDLFGPEFAELAPAHTSAKALETASVAQVVASPTPTVSSVQSPVPVRPSDVSTMMVQKAPETPPMLMEAPVRTRSGSLGLSAATPTSRPCSHSYVDGRRFCEVCADESSKAFPVFGHRVNRIV